MDGRVDRRVDGWIYARVYEYQTTLNLVPVQSDPILFSRVSCVTQIIMGSRVYRGYQPPH